MDLINKMDQDETSRVSGGDQEIKVLEEMNELEQEHNQYIEDLGAKPTVY